MKKISPVLIYKMFIGLMLVPLLLPVKSQVVFPYNLLGLLPFLYGTYMAIASKRLFKQTGTPMHPFANPAQLHQQSFFKYTRNPMYLGIAIALFGIALLSSYIFNMLYPVLYIIICDIFYVQEEEKNLKKSFGSQYTDYMRKSKRWI